MKPRLDPRARERVETRDFRLPSAGVVDRNTAFLSRGIHISLNEQDALRLGRLYSSWPAAAASRVHREHRAAPTARVLHGQPMAYHISRLGQRQKSFYMSTGTTVARTQTSHAPFVTPTPLALSFDIPYFPTPTPHRTLRLESIQLRLHNASTRVDPSVSAATRKPRDSEPLGWAKSRDTDRRTCGRSDG